MRLSFFRGIEFLRLFIVESDFCLVNQGALGPEVFGSLKSLDPGKYPTYGLRGEIDKAHVVPS